MKCAYIDSGSREVQDNGFIFFLTIQAIFCRDRKLKINQYFLFDVNHQFYTTTHWYKTKNVF